MKKRSDYVPVSLICTVCGATYLRSPSQVKSGSRFCSYGCRDKGYCGLANGVRVRSRTYNSWAMMKNRCNNPASTQFKWYGGRGIAVCARWKRFENFLADMGIRPDGMSLDRIDSNGDYSPSNCRWATAKEQARNTRRNRIVEDGGEKMSFSEWCERNNIGTMRGFGYLNKGRSLQEIKAICKQR